MDGIANRINTLYNYPTLVLNADYQPLSYYPLSLWNWQLTIKAVFLKRVDILANYDLHISSPSQKIPLPSVVALKIYVRPPQYPTFTRFNLFLRDEFTCQYCGDDEDLTFDHLVPRSKGGKTRWDNIVAACSSCNVKKGRKFAKEASMYPHQMPYRPNFHELLKKGKKFPPNYLHESWRDYLYWDIELEDY